MKIIHKIILKLRIRNLQKMMDKYEVIANRYYDLAKGIHHDWVNNKDHPNFHEFETMATTTFKVALLGAEKSMEAVVNFSERKKTLEAALKCLSLPN